MRRLLIISALAVYSVTAVAQTKFWTLEDCIDYAMEHNLSVKQQAIMVEQNKLQLSSSMAARLPSLNGNVSENISFGRGLTADNTYANTNTTSTSFGLGSEVPIFQGFRIRHDIISKKLDLDASVAALEKMKDDIRTGIAKSFTQVLYNTELAQVADNQVYIDSLQLMRVSELEKNGKVSKVEVSQQKASLAQSYVTKVQAHNDLRLAYLDLSQLLDLPSPDSIRIKFDTNEEIIPLSDTPEDIFAYASENRAVIKSELLKLQRDAVGIKLAKSYAYPSLSLNGGVGTNYYSTSGAKTASFTNQLKNNFSQYIGLSLSIPIFSRYQIRNSVLSAQLSYNNQLIQVQQTKNALYKEIQQAWYGALSASSKYESSKIAESSASDAFDLVRAKYENGRANITEFNEARNAYLKAVSDRVQAKCQYVFQKKLLDFYME